MSGDDDVMAGWWAYLRRRNRVLQTRLAYLSEVRRYVTAVPAWRDATWRDVEGYVDRRDVGPSRARDIVSCLRSFYRYAAREGLCEHDATALVESPARPKRLPRVPPDHHVALALAQASPRMAAILALMAGCGLRAMEVAGLRWEDVDLAAGTARVVGKGNKERIAYFGPAVAARLAALDGTSGPVFHNAHGKPASPAVISQNVNEYFDAIGLAGTTAHRLRHWAATTALAQTGRLDVVRDMLGHASTATTEIYAQVVPGAAADAQRAIPLPGETVKY